VYSTREGEAGHAERDHDLDARAYMLPVGLDGQGGDGIIGAYLQVVKAVDDSCRGDMI